MDRSAELTIGKALLSAGVGALIVLLPLTLQEDITVPPLWIIGSIIVAAVGLGLMADSWLRSRKEEAIGEGWAQLDAERVATYHRTRGLFLVHSWAPSTREGQVADVTVWVDQHKTGPLTNGTIEAVEFVFGSRFEERSVVVSEPFRYETSMYGPMLCLARVHFTDGHDPLILKRYINFDTGPAAP